MSLKTGKEEIVYLLTQVFEKYERITGNEVRRNTNRKNYEEIAKMLSEISNSLPVTSANLGHEEYAPDRNKNNLSYPNLRYDITGGQIKDACNGMVSNPRSFLIDACYIYLYGVGRKRFEENPTDTNLLEKQSFHNELNVSKFPGIFNLGFWRIAAVVLFASCLFLAFYTFRTSNKLQTITADMKIGVYQPTLSEINQLVGTWLVYIGSPQARRSEKNRYHQVVTNVIDVSFKGGYFVFKRYGANFNHNGYMQFESKDIISIHSYVSNDRDTVESPRLSLMRLDAKNKFQSVISASWNFDTGEYNDVIGIREVYIKQSNFGSTKEILNTIENSSCKCKIIRLDEGSKHRNYYLKNILLDSLPDKNLRTLLDENSILLRNPDSTVLIGNLQDK
ncbi:hypothetical protein [Pedobacter miscanthi]|uniref:hypothetical protein n=1 Tax=Pedobacter miscanthi TaxID=2259170 RepID=UPI00292DDCFB|nr:hypothetical protein [Pedobacter miscanthi]